MKKHIVSLPTSIIVLRQPLIIKKTVVFLQND
eukprot:COSAG06_NODE_32227_length_509_cov_1.214634_1_plen_31_part_01